MKKKKYKEPMKLKPIKPMSTQTDKQMGMNPTEVRERAGKSPHLTEHYRGADLFRKVKEGK